MTARSIFHQVDAAAQIMLLTSPASLEHLKEVRRFFERGMVREAALKATDAEIAELGPPWTSSAAALATHRPSSPRI